MQKITEGLQYFPVFQNRFLNGFTSENKISEIYYFKKKLYLTYFCSTQSMSNVIKQPKNMYSDHTKNFVLTHFSSVSHFYTP